MVTSPVARDALEVYEVDEQGLDRLDRAILSRPVPAVRGRSGGAVHARRGRQLEERETVEEVAEPFLVRAGLLARTPRGRVATPAAWRHLGLAPPQRAPDLFSGDDVLGAPGPGAAGV